MPQSLKGRSAHHDRPLSNFAVQAFAQGPGSGYIAQSLFPSVPVNHQNDRYYTIDKASYLRTEDSKRSPRTRANRVEWKVSSDGYFADNYALADEIPLEDLANADNVLNLRQGSVSFVTDMLLRDKEVRVADKVTSISNVGSGVSLTGATRWTSVDSADIFGQVSTATAFIRGETGIIPNTMVVDYDSFQLMRRNSRLLEMFKYTSGGQLSMDQLKELFNVQNLWVGNAIRNSAKEGAAATMVDVWGDNCLLAYVNPTITRMRAATFGLTMNWRPEGMATDMQVERSRIDDAGSEKVEVIEAGYFADEKIVGKELSYLINDTQA